MTSLKSWEKYHQPKILYKVKIPFKNDEKIDILKVKLREFTTNIFELRKKKSDQAKEYDHIFKHGIYAEMKTSLRGIIEGKFKICIFLNV